MAFQPQDEQNDVQNIYECIRSEAQCLQNTVLNPKPVFNFSSIIDVASHPQYNIQEFHNNEQDPPNLSDEEDKIDKIMNGMESDFGDMSCDERIDCLTKQLDMLELELINQSIEDRTMSVEVQPPTDMRRRYETDGKRQIEKSRSKPMAIKLPDLKPCELKPDQSFWLQLFLLTTDENPSNTVYIHSDILEYHADDTLRSDYGSVRVLITPKDIQEGMKQLARISIIKKKLDSYTFQLIPFASLSTNPTQTIYENQNAKTVVAKAKRFRKLYNLTSSRIACQLIIKQNNTWCTTDIVCTTNIMEEKKQTDNKESSKRSVYDDGDDDEVYQPSPAKKRKQSSLLTKGLPVIRVAKT